MTSFDFEYYKPSSLDEAIGCYNNLIKEGKTVLYYGGGTEIISMARAESIRFNAVIDIKGIPECNVLSIQNDDLIIGSAVTLTQIAESGCYPLLCATSARIADHTIQGKITLGGNLSGTIIYREAALPLLITDCRVKIMTAGGLKELSFPQVFDGCLKLEQGDFLAQVLIDKNDINLPYNHVKRTKMDKIDYPLISMAANKKDSRIRAAVSGLIDMPTELPFDALNDMNLSEDERVSQIIARVNELIISDIHGSKEYRIFVLRNILSQMYENLRGV